MLEGVAVSPGIAIGRAVLFHREELELRRYTLDESMIDEEVERFMAAVEKTKHDLKEIQKKSEQEIPGDHAKLIFQAHLMFLEDPMFVDEISREIESSACNAEYAMTKVTNDFIDQLSRIDNEYLSGRAIDVRDVSRHVMHNLLGTKQTDLSSLSSEAIVIAHDLSPSDTALMDKERVLGFATDVGSRTSHTAIMARALEIPAVVGLGNVTSQVRNNDIVIIDGNRGRILVNPDEIVFQDYLVEQEEFQEFEKSFDVLKELPAETIDNHRIALAGNIEIPEEVDSVLEHGAKGIGLYRTEFLYIRKKEMPSEDEQYEFYKDAAEKVAPDPVIIRTLDLGGDKFASYLQFADDANSIMGLRAIRLCLQRPDIFLPQLRAIMRASVHGNLKIMFPMISDVDEFRQAKAFLEQAKDELSRAGTPFDPSVEVGLMIEVPSAAMTADILAKEADFFSIGTNDLIQYTLAVHRINEEIAYLYEPLHPAVLRLIQRTVEAAQVEGIWVGMCGEMASDPVMIPVLLGMGLDELSMSPTAVPVAKKIIRSLTMGEAQEIANQAFSFLDAWEVEHYVCAEAMKRFPELLTWITLRA